MSCSYTVGSMIAIPTVPRPDRTYAVSADRSPEACSRWAMIFELRRSPAVSAMPLAARETWFTSCAPSWSVEPRS